MDTRTPEQRRRHAAAVEKSQYLRNMSPNRINRLMQYEQKIGRELTLDEIKARFSGPQKEAPHDNL